MSELIEISNYLLLNYWWIIVPSAFVFGCAAAYLECKITNNRK